MFWNRATSLLQILLDWIWRRWSGLVVADKMWTRLAWTQCKDWNVVKSLMLWEFCLQKHWIILGENNGLDNLNLTLEMHFEQTLCWQSWHWCLRLKNMLNLVFVHKKQTLPLTISLLRSGAKLSNLARDRALLMCISSEWDSVRVGEAFSAFNSRKNYEYISTKNDWCMHHFLLLLMLTFKACGLKNKKLG